MISSLILNIFILVTGISAFLRPWTGVIAYFLLSLWHPQLIWFWAFGHKQVPLMVALATFAGFGKDFMLNRVNISLLKRKETLYWTILWISMAISYLFCPYGADPNAILSHNSKLLFEAITKNILFFCMALLLVDERRKFHLFMGLLVFVTVYYTYWANDMYLSGRMHVMYGPRLGGPGGAGGGGVYLDENVFAMLFVVGIPFLYFMGGYYQKRFIKFFFWAVIPLAWHAIFLTGSLGGTIGLLTVSLFIWLRMQNKLLKLVFPAIFLIAFIWQGGAFLQDRIDKHVADRSSSSRGESTATQRINSWKAGLGMIAQHPLTGVGLGNFYRAYPDFSNTTPHVAHNTFFQFAAETGVITGIIYLLFFWNLFKDYWHNLKNRRSAPSPFFDAAMDAVSGGALGFFICALFLNLATYEILYYLLALAVIRKNILAHENRTSEKSDHRNVNTGAIA